MPKYYRYRATTPTRKPKRKDLEHKAVERNVVTEPGKNFLEFSIACTPTVSWYLRRTAWREPPASSFTKFPISLAGLRSSLQVNNQSIAVLRIPGADSLHTKDALRQIISLM